MTVDQKLLEVPFHLSGELYARLLARQILVERVYVITFDGDLGKDREGNAFGRAELGDLFVGAGLLVAKVVGGEGENPKALGLVLLVE